MSVCKCECGYVSVYGCVYVWVHASVNARMLHLTGGSKSYSTLC